jgi:AcrR family transcriptional regulator
VLASQPTPSNDLSLVTVVTGDLDTRARLVTAAAHLFARRGIEGTALRDVVAFAGQRNASAVQYHFGGRWELVAAILADHAETVEGWRDPGDGTPVEAVVASLVALLRPELATPEGRDLLRIVFELTARYPGRWDHAPGAHRGMTALLDRLVAGLPQLPPDLARARAVAATQFVSYQLAERARLVDEGAATGPEARFTAELVAMSTAMLTAPRPQEDLA